MLSLTVSVFYYVVFTELYFKFRDPEVFRDTKYALLSFMQMCMKWCTSKAELLKRKQNCQWVKGTMYLSQPGTRHTYIFKETFKCAYFMGKRVHFEFNYIYIKLHIHSAARTHTLIAYSHIHTNMCIYRDSSRAPDKNITPQLHYR